MNKIRWGILSTGSIARTFVEGLRFVEDAEVVAVGSRNREQAEQFGEKYGIPHRHSSYEALAADPDVDVIYVATPHIFHHENTMLCLRAGKAVLCEKAFTINAAEAAEMIDYAHQHKLFLMEAMWVRYLPVHVKLRELLKEGIIGDVKIVHADFSFSAPYNPQSRLFNLELGGGALLDAGIYPVSMASMILGTPSKITSLTHLGESGSDEQTVIQFGYPEGKLSTLVTSTRVAGPQDLLIRGTKGYIKISQWLRPSRLTIVRPQQEDEVIELPVEGNGYNYEAAEVGRCLREGLLESPVMPLDESLALMQTMDAIRAPWGLKYPTE
ncbi:MAG: Gfo/Idh/MocA family oxidoreductase [Chloroflexi bacterium]|nr:Gfo/Idh/MocA family oxidoreductase [Chloroflexota bacterium]OJV94839.1 MAG: dehydrogenase [Chloroflexi bacterium 54-19]